MSTRISSFDFRTVNTYLERFLQKFTVCLYTIYEFCVFILHKLLRVDRLEKKLKFFHYGLRAAALAFAYEPIYSPRLYKTLLGKNMSTGFEKIGSDPQLQDHWIRRLVAFIIDSIIVSVCTLIIAAIISIPFILIAAATGLPRYIFDPFSFPFFAGILSVLYFTFLETYYGWTFGKRIMNLKTTKLDGQKPLLDLALIRNISKIYWILVLIDTVIGLATKGDTHQKVTDRIAGTTVVSTSASPLAGITAARRTVKFCSYCKQRLSEEAKYCPHCGKEQA